ncbi:MAG: HAD family hydrolase [bacterium]
MPEVVAHNIDLLIFDLDGTLVDTRQDLANAVNFALQQMGKRPLTLEKVTSLVGDGVRTLLERALAVEGEATLAKALAYFRGFYAGHLSDHSRLYPHMRDVLAHFRAKKKAVLSNKPQEFTYALLERLELLPAFEWVIGGHAGLPLKPDPQALQSILEQSSTPGERAAMIGDGENDILAGKAAGVTTCAVTYGFRPVEKLLALQPDLVAHAPEDLMSLFK